MDDTLLCVDVGTTNTRVWLTQGAEVLVRHEAPVGARDTARDRHPGALTVRSLTAAQVEAGLLAGLRAIHAATA
jgi:2-keto-3-deoxy-galactonokinase